MLKRLPCVGGIWWTSRPFSANKSSFALTWYFELVLSYYRRTTNLSSVIIAASKSLCCCCSINTMNLSVVLLGTHSMSPMQSFFPARKARDSVTTMEHRKCQTLHIANCSTDSVCRNLPCTKSHSQCSQLCCQLRKHVHSCVVAITIKK